MRIAHNLIVDHFRRNSKMPIVPNRPDCDIVDTLKLHDENVEQNIMRQQTHRNVRKLVKMLPPEQRRVVILRHYGKCDFKDIAARTGVSINTALGRMRYAIINLRRLAEEHNIYLELWLPTYKAWLMGVSNIYNEGYPILILLYPTPIEPLPHTGLYRKNVN